MKKASIFLIIILIYIAAVGVRLAVYENNRYASFMPLTQESAFHYYFAKKIANGQGIPAVEYDIQRPEGLRVFEATSIFMEYAAGYLYRFVSFVSGVRFDFTKYISFFVPLSSCLSIFALYLTSRLILGNDEAACISTLMYAVLWPAVSRTLGFMFLRENFSLPLIFFFIYFYMKYLNSKKMSDILISGLMLYIALASWHFTQFIYLAFIGFAAICVIFNKEEGLPQGFMALTCFAILAGLSIPYLRAIRFILSPAMLISYSIIITTLLRRSVKMASISRTLVLLGISGILLLLTHQTSGNYGAYSHVYSLGISKLRFFGLKPCAPNLVPREARQLWSFAFFSPNLSHFSWNFFIISFISAPMVIKTIRSLLRNKENKARIFALYCLVVSLILYWFSLRLRILPAFFLALYAGGLMLVFKTKLLRRIMLIILMLCFSVLSHQSLSAKIAPLSSVYEIDIFRWICLHTEEKDVILSTPFRSAQILAYTNRPIILHPKYETKVIRTKASDFNRALLERGEESFYHLCKRWGADYLILPKGIYLREDGESIRYVMDNLESDKDVIAYKLEALPEQRKEFEGHGFIGIIETGYRKPDLEHFELAYRNKHYLIYEIF